MILNLSYKKNDHGYRVWHHHGRWRCWPIETGSYIPVARGNYTCMVDVNICIWISMYQYVIIISFKGDDPLFTSRWIVSTYENNLARLCNTKVLSCTQTCVLVLQLYRLIVGKEVYVTNVIHVYLDFAVHLVASNMNTMLTVYIEFFLFIRLHSYLNKWR